jgi:nucleoside-diphosphate-sugar epimerase
MAKPRERILITGGSGFIGAALARKLIGDGHMVHLLLRPQSDLWRLADLKHHYTSHWADLLDIATVRRAVSECCPHIIYHLAAYGAYPFQQHRSTILNTNLIGTANLLEALADCEFRAFVNVGSSSEYGHRSGPIRESDPLSPRTDYAVSKAAAALLCQAEAFRGRPITTVRVFSAFGPWDDPRRLVPEVIASCLREEPPRVTDGRQPRDFIFIDDVLSLLETAAHCSASHGTILHAATGCQRPVRDMIEAIIAVSGARVAARYGELSLRAEEPSSWVGDIAQTTALTGWQPKFDLLAGVEKTWSWYATHAAVNAA